MFWGRSSYSYSARYKVCQSYIVCQLHLAGRSACCASFLGRLVQRFAGTCTCILCGTMRNNINRREGQGIIGARTSHCHGYNRRGILNMRVQSSGILCIGNWRIRDRDDTRSDRYHTTKKCIEWRIRICKNRSL